MDLILQDFTGTLPSMRELLRVTVRLLAALAILHKFEPKNVKGPDHGNG